MKNIILACAAGMSTSMLVSKMKKAAEEQGVDVKIAAIPVASVEEKIEEENVDVLLLGPQVRYMDSKMSEVLDPKGIKHGIIAMQDYGMMNGKKVLDDALKLIEE